MADHGCGNAGTAITGEDMSLLPDPVHGVKERRDVRVDRGSAATAKTENPPFPVERIQKAEHRERYGFGTHSMGTLLAVSRGKML